MHGSETIKTQILSSKHWNNGSHTKNMTNTFSKLNHEDETFYATKKES